MIDTLRWLLVLELIGAAVLPFTLWMFSHLPDRGFALTKTLGLVLLTFGVWLTGELLPIAGGVWLPLAVLGLAAVASWWGFGARARAAWTEVRRTIVIEECLFLLAFIAWTVMRAVVFHPGISHTEQYMDMSMLGAAVRSTSYPPYDPWMSGHTVNYYYLGYVMYALVTKLSGVLPTVGYNLALSTLFALVAGNTYAVGLALTRRLLYALAAPVAVVLLGNWHAILVQLPRGIGPGGFNWFWESTRVIGAGNTITEFPYFSFMLGDLHPHVMALPVTVLAIALGLSILFDPTEFRLRRAWQPWLRLFTIAVSLGSLFVLNSWDFPTYALFVAGCIGAAAYVTDATPAWWRAPLLAIAALGVLSVGLYTPFYLQYRAPTRGFGWVTTPSNPAEFLQVFGLFIAACAVLLAAYSALFQPEQNAAESASRADAPAPETSALETGAARVADSPMVLVALVALLVLVLGLRLQVWVFLALALLATLTGVMLYRALNTSEPNRADIAALGLMLVGFSVVGAAEVVYIRDVFDGGAAYRMNTVFKFDYQGWTLLGLAAAYGLTRATGIFRAHFHAAIGVITAAILLAGGAGAAAYTILAPQSANWGGTATGLDGATALRDTPPQSGDYRAISWLRSRTRSSNPVELEAVGKPYDADSARVSTFTGLPTVMGWQDHEVQWRGADREIQTRATAVTTIYTTPSIARARALLRRYNVTYVFVGSAERAIAGADLAKFRRFMHVAYRDPGATIYTW